MTQQPDDLVERQKLIEKLRAPWFANGCEQYQREAADRIEADAATITALRQQVAELEGAVLAEREACAKVAEGFSRMMDKPNHADAAKLISHAIRNRSNDHD